MKTCAILYRLSALFFVFQICSCAPSRFVKPLNKGEQAVNVSVGGPVIGYHDVPLPMPFLTATYGYGIDSSFTAFGSLNITSALYGNAQIEAGLVKRILKQNGAVPGISLTPVANLIYRNKDASKLYPQLDLNAYWTYHKGRNFFYTGLSNWFELANTKAYGVKQDHHWLASPQIGEYFIRKKWNLNIELKVVAANVSSQKTVADYQTPLGHNGALAIYVGYTKKFK